MATKPYILNNPPAPGTDAWVCAISASKVPPMVKKQDGTYAGLGYITAFEQYEQLKGRFTQKFSGYMLNRFDEAHAMEYKAAEWWISQQDNPEHWTLSDGEVAYHNPNFPELDFATIDRIATNTETGEQVALEVKNPDAPGLQPGWIFQHIAQQIASGLKGGIIVAPRTGEETFSYHPLDVTDEQKDKVKGFILDFKALLDSDTPPPGGSINLEDADIEELKTAMEDLKKAETRVNELKKSYIEKLGSAKNATFNDTPIITKVAGQFAKTRIPKEMKATLTDPDVLTTETVMKFNEKAYAAKYPELYAAAQGDPSIKLLPALTK